MLFKEDEAARAEARAIRENAGWYRWTHDLVEVQGSDAGRFVQHLFVSDMDKVPVGRSKYTTMLSEDGKIIDDVIVMHMGDDLYWVSTLYGPQFVAWADEHDDGFDVTCRDITKDVDMYAVQGPNSLAMMNDLAAEPVDDLKRFAIMNDSIAGVDVKIHRAGFTGELGYEIYVPMEQSSAIEAALNEVGEKMGVPELQILEVYVRSIPVEKGFALRQDMYGLTPYECDLGWSVAMDTDFVGKEALQAAVEAGNDYRLVGLEFLNDSYEDIAQREIVYRKGVPCGFVRAAIYGYTVDKNIGFAVIEAAKAINGEEVTVGENESPAIICDKVFV